MNTVRHTRPARLALTSAMLFAALAGGTLAHADDAVRPPDNRSSYLGDGRNDARTERRTFQQGAQNDGRDARPEARQDGLDEGLCLEANRVALLYLHFLDGAPLHISDVKTTEQLLANQSIDNLRTEFLGHGRKEQKLLRKLRGRDVRVTHGLAETLAQLEPEPPELHQRVIDFLDGLVSHYLLDRGRLVVAHAGLREEMHGRASGRVREFALYGETTALTEATRAAGDASCITAITG